MLAPGVRIDDGAPANGRGGRGETDDETIPFGQRDRLAQPQLRPSSLPGRQSILSQKTHLGQRLGRAGEELELSVVSQWTLCVGQIAQLYVRQNCGVQPAGDGDDVAALEVGFADTAEVHRYPTAWYCPLDLLLVRL